MYNADVVQLAIAEETTPGVPGTEFYILRYTGESLTFNPILVEDNNIGGSRSSDTDVSAGMTLDGSISFRFSLEPWIMMALYAVLGTRPNENPLIPGSSVFDPNQGVVGKTLRTFTIEKRFPDEVTDGYTYHRFVGASFSTMTFSLPANEVVTGEVTVVGGRIDITDTALTGTVYHPPENKKEFMTPDISELSIGTQLGIGTHCWQNLEITLDSQNEGISCLGTVGEREISLGSFLCLVTGDVYFVDQSILDHVIQNQKIGDGTLILNNKANEAFRFDFFDLVPLSGTLNAGGVDEQLLIPMELQPTPKVVCKKGTEVWRSPLIIREDAKDPLFYNEAMVVKTPTFDSVQVTFGQCVEI